MTTKKKIRVYYRAPSHVPLWKVMEEGGFLEKHGLEMDLGSMEGQRKRAAEGLKSGELDVVSGNHHNLYAHRALNGTPYVHVGQSNNSWRENYLVAREGINSVKDLKGKSVAMDDYDGHTGLNVWLYLRLNGLEEGRDVTLVTDNQKAPVAPAPSWTVNTTLALYAPWTNSGRASSAPGLWKCLPWR